MLELGEDRGLLQRQVSGVEPVAGLVGLGDCQGGVHGGAVDAGALGDLRGAHAEQGEEEEHSAPVNVAEGEDDEVRSKGTTPSRGEPEEALGPVLLGRGQAEAEGAVDVRERAGLANAEQGAHDDKRGEVPGLPSGGGEERPPEDDAGEDVAGTDAVAEDAAG